MIQRLGLLLVILMMRFYALGVRPPHHDEAVNGWFVDGIFDRGFYHYDPSNYHGPFFFYVLTFFETIFGRSIEVLRMPPVLFGIGLSLTPLLFKKWIGDKAAWIATFFLAVSPACVFYSRYTIHETGFALACAVFLYFWFCSRRDGLSTRNVWGLGLTLGLMATLKENFVIFVGSLVLAEVIIYFMPRVFKVSPNDHAFNVKHLAPSSKNLLLKAGAIFGIAGVFIAINYTAFGKDWVGLKNFFVAFSFWSDTGSKGNGHQKPFYYWVQLLSKYEWLALLGLFTSVLALKKVKTEVRILSALGFGLWLAYSIVSYKTPWCLLSYYFVLIMVGAYWVVQWMEKGKTAKFILSIFVVCQFFISAYKAIEVSYVDVDSDNHPYIYGQTYRTLMPPIQEILDQVHASPEAAKNMRIQIISKYTWPLPWLLGEIKQTAYHSDRNPPERLDANYLFIDADLESQFTSRIVGYAEGKYRRTVVRARQWAAPMVIYVRSF